MRKMMRVIEESHNAERERRQSSRILKRMDEPKTRTQIAKALVSETRRVGVRKEENEKSLEKIFGEGNSQEIKKATSEEKIIEMIDVMSKRETQFDELEKMRQESNKRPQKKEG